ncbi:ribbon-helix-helix protein, CopG family [Nodosilinea sp. LEGE 07298]|uniref:ribbon-helix-helix domain-containing protein n=1 Tax=Nodosilinea sp. LEGE 07298 TaxID=2777970 RepID=UPI001880A516|nr:ribbon-helix-helix domain-containing protein [Nodosilinea sp. LEGE 07298]MBE9112473.1 ribbon-helix-helix protein, CopG family [Nodosilinea sp. LEGE 07298]
MANTPNKRRVSITLDAELLDAIDRLSDNRSAVIEEALRLWRNQKIDDQLRQFYQSRSQADLDQEEAWAEFAQQQLEETIENEGI